MRTGVFGNFWWNEFYTAWCPQSSKVCSSFANADLCLLFFWPSVLPFFIWCQCLIVSISKRGWSADRDPFSYLLILSLWALREYATGITCGMRKYTTRRMSFNKGGAKHWGKDGWNVHVGHLINQAVPSVGVIRVEFFNPSAHTNYKPCINHAKRSRNGDHSLVFVMQVPLKIDRQWLEWFFLPCPQHVHTGHHCDVVQWSWVQGSHAILKPVKNQILTEKYVL